MRRFVLLDIAAIAAGLAVTAAPALAGPAEIVEALTARQPTLLDLSLARAEALLAAELVPDGHVSSVSQQDGEILLSV